MMKLTKLSLILAMSMTTLTACHTVSYIEQLSPSILKQNTPATPTTLILTQHYADQLNKLNNEVVIDNITKVTHQVVTIDNKQYAMLSFHTKNHQIYHTRVETNRLTVQHLERMKTLKGVTFIGVLAIPNQTNQFFFKNFKDFKY